MRVLFAFVVLVVMSASAIAADLTSGMQVGTPELKSAGPATFAPQGILLVGDTAGATIYAIATGDTAVGSPAQPLAI